MMRFRNVLLSATMTVVVAGAAFAQTDKQKHDHDSAKAADSKASTDAAKPSIAAKDLKQRLDGGEKIAILDARHDLGGQILKGAIHVPSDKLEEWAKDVDKNAVIVTYCTCPHDEAADGEVRKLRELGFKNAYALSGGLDAARSAGFEVVTPADK
jgi:rhodanese-related sulfurtransferase